MDSSPQNASHKIGPDEQGNYNSPALDELSRVWEDYCDEIATADDVWGVICEIGGFAQYELGVLEAQVERGVSDPEDETFSLICEGFELLLEACDTMLLEFAEELPEGSEEPEDGFFTAGFELVQEATNSIAKGHAMGLEHIEAMAEVLCLFCQHVNSRENLKCGKCGRALPTASDLGGPSTVDVVEHQGLEKKPLAADGEVTENYVMTANILEAWKAGAVEPVQLSEFLGELEARFVSHLEELPQHLLMIEKAPQEQQAALTEALEMTREGLHLSLDSVAKMNSAFELKDDRYLFFWIVRSRRSLETPDQSLLVQ